MNKIPAPLQQSFKELDIDVAEQGADYTLKSNPKQFVYAKKNPVLDDGSLANGLTYRITIDGDDSQFIAYDENHRLEAVGISTLAAGFDNKSRAHFSTTFGAHNINGGYVAFLTGSNNVALGGIDNPDGRDSSITTMKS